MAVIYCPEESLLESVLAALPDWIRSTHCADWARFDRMLAADTCGVVVVRWLEDGPNLLRLVALSSRRRAPLVLVTSKDADNVRLLKGVALEEVVWLSDLPASLGAAIHAARLSRPLLVLSRRIERNRSLVPVLRGALAAACRQPSPPTTVAALAGLAGVDRRVLWRAWRNRFGLEPPLRLEDVTAWLVIAHAASGKRPGRRWSAVAGDVGVHLSTLRRLIRRLCGLGLKDAGREPERIVAMMMEALSFLTTPAEGRGQSAR